ncbi:MAG TPA: biotin/lipoyl-containing protein [Polyangiaceae bacterium]
MRYVVSVGNHEVGVDVSRLGDGRLLVTIEGSSEPPVEVTLLDTSRDPVVNVDGRILELFPNGRDVALRAERRGVRVENRERRDRPTNAASSGAAGTVRAPMPGRVVKVLVAPGTTVEKGAGLVVVEAMKMENELVAPVAGAVERVFVGAGDAVERGAPLVEIR